ncbi:hypothetical protein H4R34_002809 [Dimargaris verticillata]|uniref:Uncharacterized protein n=1 Tax=Dimargaris verticillata TaxID=2761393 RepID=A0A9W8B234_9FUNG|nr:hypothetical protein H4R34_002809 [Dimargaris verticillata]
MTSGPRYPPSVPAQPLPPRRSGSPPAGGHRPRPFSSHPRPNGHGPPRPPHAFHHHPYNHPPWWRSRPEWHLSPHPRPRGPFRQLPEPEPALTKPYAGAPRSVPSPPSVSMDPSFSLQMDNAPMLPRLEPVLPDVLTMADPTLPRDTMAIPVNQQDKEALARLRLPALRTATVDRTESLMMHTQLRVHFIHT